MRLGIDASNLRLGGGRTHLIELLRNASPATFGFDRVAVWGSRATLDCLDDRDWLDKRNDVTLEGGMVSRARWQRYRLRQAMATEGCDVLFAPGGSFTTSFRPVVTMSRNMLPFDMREIRRYGVSRRALRFLVLRKLQAKSLSRASAVIFLTEFARREVTAITGDLPGAIRTIPHGIDTRFFAIDRAQEMRPPADAPARVVYVSTIDFYKHQDRVVEAAMQLGDPGERVRLDLIGPAFTPALGRLNRLIDRLDSERKVVSYRGAVPYDELHRVYGTAEIGVFASSCENMPNILLEMMAAGLPIACSDRGPMPEILGDAGLYFDPESAHSIAGTLRTLLRDPALRISLSLKARARARQYSWKRCADESFGFLAEVAAAHSRSTIRST